VAGGMMVHALEGKELVNRRYRVGIFADDSQLGSPGTINLGVANSFASSGHYVGPRHIPVVNRTR